MKNNNNKISKKEFYELGGFANSSLFRKHNGKYWEYYKKLI